MSEISSQLRTEFENRIRFETLISDISAHFVRLPSSEVDGEIERALKQILDFFDVDRCGVLKVQADKEFARLTHVCYAEGVEPLLKDINMAQLFPWTYEMMTAKGLPARVGRMTELPPEAEQDRQSCLATDVKSFLCIPLFCVQGIRYLLAIQSVRDERIWPEEFIPRLTLLGEIFVNAMERRIKDQALSESQSRLNLAAESAGAGMWILDVDSRVFWVTEKAKELFGFLPDSEITVERFLEKVHPEDRDRIHQIVERSPQSKEEFNAEYRIICPDGNIRWMASRGRFRSGDSEEKNRLMGVTIDITERKRTDEEILWLREEYTHISRVSAMGELTASLAHELKQPLAAIRSNAQAALRFLTGDKPDMDELHDVLKDIIADNRRADDVIGKLRRIMRKTKPQIMELDIKELIQDIIPLVTSHEMMRKISLDLELDEAIPPVVGDRIQIQQVILNLILNSTEALMNIKRPSRSITVRTHQQDSRTVMVSVTDNGPGIEAEAMPHLFEAFYTTKPEGLGMGLAICRSIVESHRGRLWAQNNPDAGATFYFTIPIARED